ncbi:MAG TPA: hypothetical protein VKA10_10150, partial [Prolixibacteraceae bacterium]|nr:hypothetical protein [Prolixibacteraceae bacterium]
MKGKAKTSENIKIKDLKDLLDQKNEELNQKNRELKIESALEKVRSASMSMQQSNELQKVVSVIFEQLQDLNFALDGAAAFIMTDVEDFNGVELWMEDKVTHPVRFRLPYYDAPSINDIYSAR